MILSHFRTFTSSFSAPKGRICPASEVTFEPWNPASDCRQAGINVLHYHNMQHARVRHCGRIGQGQTSGRSIMAEIVAHKLLHETTISRGFRAPLRSSSSRVLPRWIVRHDCRRPAAIGGSKALGKLIRASLVLAVVSLSDRSPFPLGPNLPLMYALAAESVRPATDAGRLRHCKRNIQ